MNELIDFLDSDIFHNCALAAYWEVMCETKKFPPDKKISRKKAYQYYEQYKRKDSK